MAIKVQRRRLSFTRVAFVVLAALCVAYSVLPHATARSVLQAKPGGVDTSAVPEACVQTGLNLQSACSAELSAGTQALGIQDPLAAGASGGVSVNEPALRAFLAKAAPPSAGCCAGAKAFNDAKCSCSPPVLELVKGFTGGSTSTYAILAQWLADKCKFPLIFGPGKC